MSGVRKSDRTCSVTVILRDVHHRKQILRTSRRKFTAGARLTLRSQPFNEFPWGDFGVRCQSFLPRRLASASRERPPLLIPAHAQLSGTALNCGAALCGRATRTGVALMEGNPCHPTSRSTVFYRRVWRKEPSTRAPNYCRHLVTAAKALPSRCGLRSPLMCV